MSLLSLPVKPPSCRTRKANAPLPPHSDLKVSPEGPYKLTWRADLPNASWTTAHYLRKPSFDVRSESHAGTMCEMCTSPYLTQRKMIDARTPAKGRKTFFGCSCGRSSAWHDPPPPGATRVDLEYDNKLGQQLTTRRSGDNTPSTPRFPTLLLRQAQSHACYRHSQFRPFPSWDIWSHTSHPLSASTQCCPTSLHTPRRNSQLLRRAEEIGTVPPHSEYKRQLDCFANRFAMMRMESNRAPGTFNQLRVALLHGLTYKLFSLCYKIEAIKSELELKVDEQQNDMEAVTSAEVPRPVNATATPVNDHVKDSEPTLPLPVTTA